MALPYDVRETESFEISWKKFSFKAGEDYRAFDESVVAAVQRLEREGPGTGKSKGDAMYAVPITEGYELVYEWVTERDEHGNATFNHLYLALIKAIR